MSTPLIKASPNRINLKAPTHLTQSLIKETYSFHKAQINIYLVCFLGRCGGFGWWFFAVLQWRWGMHLL
jgi:hypothetical protein